MTHRAMAAARTARRGVNAQPPSAWNRLRARLIRPLFEAVPRGVRHALAYVDAQDHGDDVVILHRSSVTLARQKVVGHRPRLPDLAGGAR